MSSFNTTAYSSCQQLLVRVSPRTMSTAVVLLRDCLNQSSSVKNICQRLHAESSRHHKSSPADPLRCISMTTCALHHALYAALWCLLLLLRLLHGNIKATTKTWRAQVIRFTACIWQTQLLHAPSALLSQACWVCFSYGLSTTNVRQIYFAMTVSSRRTNY